MKFQKTADFEKVDLNMTPMIDVCFQLIIFFMLSLKLFSAEGDFSIAMPVAAPREGLPPDNPQLPVKVRLISDRDGNLTSIQMGHRSVASFKTLNKQIREVAKMDRDRGPGATPSDTEVELDCDYNLRFEYVVDALSAVAGFVSDDKQSIVRMIEKIKFAPPRKPEQ